MLVLSRKKNETVVFNGPGTVTVLDIRGDKVRLGFKADPTVAIHRQEVADAIRDDRERVRQAALDGTLDKLEQEMDLEDNA